MDPASIHDVLSGDHAAMGRLLHDLQVRPSTDSLDAFEAAISRHMAWEETVLFPALLALPGDRRRHVDSLVADHDLIRDHLRSLRAHLAASRRDAANAELDLLLIRLTGHNDDEEYGAYRDIDRFATETSRRAMLARFAGA